MRVRHKTEAPGAVWAPSLLRRVLRHRATWAAAVVVIGLWSATSLSARARALDTERASWGELQAVTVMVHAVEPGELVAPATQVRELPAAMVPDDAARHVEATSRAKVALHPGEIVLGSRLTGVRSSGPPAGTVALTVPVLAHVPLMAVGDLVDLWMVDAANFSSHRVAHRVVVLAFSESDVTVAVPDDQIAGATVASLRPITITLIG